MLAIARLSARRLIRLVIRRLISWLPRKQRFRILRSFVDCNLAPTPRLVLKIAETKEELEACFKVLHDAYVDSGFMEPHPSGMRVTVYHALPTTTTLCALFDGQVVGTISLIRESALGVPLQKIFDLSSVRQKKGQIAEVSALAVHRKFRHKGGVVLFPLMKFMYEYCTTFFDTRHLVIAVNPRHIEMYESFLFFQRLSANVVDNYDFVNGAPAIGATLDLREAPGIFRKHYSSKPPHRNLYAYFTEVKLPNIKFPNRRFFTTNDPVLTPELLDYFFNIRTNTLDNLSDRKKFLLHTIYDLPAYKAVLPSIQEVKGNAEIRRHQRFSVKCPARIVVHSDSRGASEMPIVVVEVSLNGFKAWARRPLPLDMWCDTVIQLGRSDVSRLISMPVRDKSDGGEMGYYGFKLKEADTAWRKFVSALYKSTIYSDLETPTRFMQ
ncbi:GNAT family N-acetyltransferase [Propionivibrio limicola]|uniref:GNAT family N-acetyltransferase n=1 Tax=Propionivibrio limicola TaxID=167645 RepID=UPI0012915DE8|nr:GNAT family N-acetyltransferase [Propionivibrio limicola]